MILLHRTEVKDLSLQETVEKVRDLTILWDTPSHKLLSKYEEYLPTMGDTMKRFRSALVERSQMSTISMRRPENVNS